ncbi:MAG: DUF4249 domain-containing protein [Bacteroidia bacterium]
MKNLIYLTLILLIASSCQKTIEFDGEITESKLVVNSIFNTEDTFRIQVSNSLSLIDDANLKFIKDATVKLYDDQDQLVSTPIHNSSGFYTDSEFKFQENKTYRIEVEKDGYKNVSATDQIPTQANVNAIDTQTVKSTDGYEQVQVTVDFDDAEGKNYYMVEVKMEYYYKWDSFEYSGWETAYVGTIDPNVEGNNNTGEYYSDRLILSDNNFNGNKYKLRFNLDKYIFQNDFRNVVVRFYSMSESVYNYFTSVERYENVQGNPFATPVQVYSNVENGFGIFGGSSIYTFNLTD